MRRRSACLTGCARGILLDKIGFGHALRDRHEDHAALGAAAARARAARPGGIDELGNCAPLWRRSLALTRNRVPGKSGPLAPIVPCDQTATWPNLGCCILDLSSAGRAAASTGIGPLC